MDRASLPQVGDAVEPAVDAGSHPTPRSEAMPSSAGTATTWQRQATLTPPPSTQSAESRASGLSGQGPSVPQPAHADATEKRPHRFRKPAPKARERVYPVFTRDTNPSVMPRAMKVHPKGFKLLSARSPLDRNLSTYFRLPPRPPQRIQQEYKRLSKVIDKVLAPEQSIKGVVLDGFMLLDATGAQDPEDALECVINDSHIVATVADDLAYFTNLAFLDIGENNIAVQDLIALANLEELHLHCNAISSIPPLVCPTPTSAQVAAQESSVDEADVQEAGEVFPRLHTLNLSFNQINPMDLPSLGQLPTLRRLDLSCNGMRLLPSNCSFFHSVTQLALENNKFVKQDTLLALATMPALVEVNLNYNSLTSVPRIPEEGFPRLEVLGIAANRIVYFEDVYPLTQLAQLRRVVMWGNPIEKRQRDSEILFYEFGNRQVELVMDPPVPPRRKTGAFYAANTENFVRVKDFRKVLGKANSSNQDQQKDVAEDSPVAPSGSSFFVTQHNNVDGTLGQKQAPQTNEVDSSTPSPGYAHSQQDAGSRAGEPGFHSWLGQWGDPEVEGRPHSGDNSSLAAHSQQRATNRRFVGRSATPAGEAAMTSSSGSTRYHPVTSLPSLHPRQTQEILDEGSIVQPNTNVRSAMAELKRMLRQPLPSLRDSALAAPVGRKKMHH